MKFGARAVADAEGTILAHSVRLRDGVLKKGTVLARADLDRLAAFGLHDVVVAELLAGDLSEDDAALKIGKALESDLLRLGPASAGRVNLLASSAGLVEIDAEAISAMNDIDEGVTLASLDRLTRVEADQLVATVKIIPYGVSGALVQRAVEVLGERAIGLRPFRGGRARLVMTQTESFKQSLLEKGESVVRARVERLGFELTEVAVVPHTVNGVAGALSGGPDLTLILGASATSDRADVAPAGVEAAGGTIDRFGMPVDPGNLLFLGQLDGHPVVGLPGCARSPALNGADWVLERLAAGLDVSSADIASMGVGGLLKEMPDRPHPRGGRKP